MSISRKLYLAAALTVTLVAILIGFSIYTIESIHRANDMRQRITDSRDAALRLDVDVLQIIVQLGYFADTRQPELLDAIDRDRREADAQRARLVNLTDDQRVRQLAYDYQASLEERRGSATAIIDAVQSGAPAAEIARLKETRRALDDRARDLLRQIITLETANSLAATERAEADIARAERGLALAGATVLALAVLVVVALSRAIIPPLRKLTVMATGIARGRLDTTNDIRTHDEIGRLARHLNHMASELKKVDDIKNNFIAIASHQLRTPATAVKQNLGLIVEGYATEDADKQRFAQAAFENNEYQLAIIDDILNVARLQAGKLRLDRKPTDLAHVVEAAVEEQRLSLKPGQQLRFRKPAAVTADVDPIKLKMCVGNLVSNAIKYTPEGGTITVTVSRSGDRAEITIKDTGVGISPTDQSKLFGRFSRIDNALSSQVNGTGLGLYLVKELVELHGGSIRVDSAVGKGSAFIIQLPV